MTAVREQIFAAAVAALGAAGIAQEVERMASGDPAKFPALHIFDEGDELEDGEAGTDRWAMTMGIDGYVEGGDGPLAHAAINALYAGTIEALFAAGTFGALVTEITANRAKFSTAERAARRRMAFALELTIYYATRRGMPQIID